jgi:hypothetical protein
VTVHPNGGGSGGQPIVVHQNFTVGDVASVTQLKQETRKSELRLMAAANRAKTYGTQD